MVLLAAAVVAVTIGACVVAYCVLRPRAPRGGEGPLDVAFVHPDLGIGGAERLIVDAAVGLQERCGHRVVIYTAHHDVGHCFEETRDGTLRVVCYGDWLPKRVRGRCYAACAYVRMCYVSLRLAVGRARHEVYVVDQV